MCLQISFDLSTDNPITSSFFSNKILETTNSLIIFVCLINIWEEYLKFFLLIYNKWLLIYLLHFH